MLNVYNLQKAKKAKFGQAPDEDQKTESPKNLIRQPVQPYQVDLSDNTLWYGEENSFPLRLATLVQESPTASSCISVLCDFLEGSGFSDDTLKDKIINGQQQTFGDIHSLVCESYALFEGFALLVKYTRDGRISEIFSIPFENVRLQRPDDKGVISKINLNPYYGTRLYQKRFTQEYDVFNPSKEVVLKQIENQGNKFKGQIMFVALTRPLSRFYPLPYYYSAHNWMAIDAGIGEFHSNNLDANFFQTVLMKMIGNPDEPSTHPDDQFINDAGEKESKRTRGQRFDLEMQQYLGSESKTKMMVLWEMMKEQMPELQAFPSLTNEQFFTTLGNQTAENILRATKTPAILANMTKDNSLSDGNQMANATKVMHIRVAKPQAMLERSYKPLLNNFKEPYTDEIKILNNNQFDAPKVDEFIWKALNIDEQRAWIKSNTDYPIIDAQGPAPVPAATPAPAPAQTRMQNIFFTDYPQSAKENAKKALKFMELNPCGTPAGKAMSEQIIDGKPLAFKDIRRIYNFLKRNQIHETKLFTDSCDSCKYAGWGGRPMFDYCAAKIQMINE